MPVIKSAKKKLRSDKKRTARNAKQNAALRTFMKAMRKAPSEKAFQAAQAAIDKAAKNHLLHKNKAARVKSSLAKLITKKEVKQTEKKAPAKKKPAARKK